VAIKKEIMQNQAIEIDTITIDSSKIDSTLKDKIISSSEKIIPITQRIIIETKLVEPKEKKEDNCNWCDCNMLISLIWPVTILLALLYFRRELKQLLTNISGRVRKIKIGGFELELHELERQTEKVERRYTDRGFKYQTYETIDDLYFDKDVRVTFIAISIEIEKTIRGLYQFDSSNDIKGKRSLLVSAMIETLHQKDIFDLDLTKLLRAFWIFRNGIVHSIKYDISEKEFKAFVNIGLRILRILKMIEQELRGK
jgi:hypothetical protein